MSIIVLSCSDNSLYRRPSYVHEPLVDLVSDAVYGSGVFFDLLPRLLICRPLTCPDDDVLQVAVHAFLLYLHHLPAFITTDSGNANLIVTVGYKKGGTA